MEYYFNWVPVPARNPKISSLIQQNVNGQRRRKKGEREGRSEKRRRGKRKNKEKKERGKRQEQSVQRREEQRRKKNSNKKGQRKEERETSRGKRGDRGGRECIFGPIVGNSFSPFTWQSFYPLIGPQKKLAHGWQSIIFFLLYLGLQQCRPIVCGQILCFLLLGPPICWQNWKSLFCFHALGPSILSLQHSQNHMVMPVMPWFYLLSWANLCSMGCKQIFLM